MSTTSDVTASSQFTTVDVEVETIEDVKARIQNKEDIPKGQHRLIFSGQQLNEDSNITEERFVCM